MQVLHARIHGSLCLNKLVDATPELGDARDEAVNLLAKAQMRAEGTFQQALQAGLRGLHDLRHGVLIR